MTSGAGVIVSARHLMGVTATAGAMLLLLGREIWKIESGGMRKLFLCAVLEGLKGHWEMTPKGSKPKRCFLFLELQSRQQVGKQSWPPDEAGGSVLAVDRGISAVGQPWGSQAYWHSKQRCSLHRSQYVSQTLKTASSCAVA